MGWFPVHIFVNITARGVYRASAQPGVGAYCVLRSNGYLHSAGRNAI